MVRKKKMKMNKKIMMKIKMMNKHLTNNLNKMQKIITQIHKNKIKQNKTKKIKPMFKLNRMHLVK